MDNKKVGLFIQQLRKERNLTQQALADAINVSDKAISKWERGDGLPETTMFPILAEYFGVTIDELFHGERISKPVPQVVINQTTPPKGSAVPAYSSAQLRIAKILMGITIFLLCSSISVIVVLPWPYMWTYLAALLTAVIGMVIVHRKATANAIPVVLNIVDITAIAGHQILWLMYVISLMSEMTEGVRVAVVTMLIVGSLSVFCLLVSIAAAIYLYVKRRHIHWGLSALIVLMQIIQALVFSVITDYLLW